jgi:hypothetical protein
MLTTYFSVILKITTGERRKRQVERVQLAILPILAAWGGTRGQWLTF